MVDLPGAFQIDAGDGLRTTEGDDNLVLWDFHDLLFHTHSTRDGRPTRWWTLSPCGRDTAAPGSAAALARKEHRSGQVFRRQSSETHSPFASCCVNVIRPAASTTGRPITLSRACAVSRNAPRASSRDWKAGSTAAVR